MPCKFKLGLMTSNDVIFFFNFSISQSIFQLISQLVTIASNTFTNVNVFGIPSSVILVRKGVFCSSIKSLLNVPDSIVSGRDDCSLVGSYRRLLLSFAASGRALQLLMA